MRNEYDLKSFAKPKSYVYLLYIILRAISNWFPNRCSSLWGMSVKIW